MAGKAKKLHPYEIIRRPISTEKTLLLGENGQYVFQVDLRANKSQIKEAVETIFEVDVVKVRVMNVAPKFGRWGRKTVKRKPAWKKAVVTLAPGQTIEMFEGV